VDITILPLLKFSEPPDEISMLEESLSTIRTEVRSTELAVPVMIAEPPLDLSIAPDESPDVSKTDPPVAPLPDTNEIEPPAIFSSWFGPIKIAMLPADPSTDSPVDNKIDPDIPDVDAPVFMTMSPVFANDSFVPNTNDPPAPYELDPLTITTDPPTAGEPPASIKIDPPEVSVPPDSEIELPVLADIPDPDCIVMEPPAPVVPLPLVILTSPPIGPSPLSTEIIPPLTSALLL
jgi:hypothetical protein